MAAPVTESMVGEVYSENECEVRYDEREKMSIDESEVVEEINLNKAIQEDITAQEVRHANKGRHTNGYEFRSLYLA